MEKSLPLKVDFYTQIHKALRRLLFLFSMRVGIADLDNLENWQYLKASLEQISSLLELHAKHENKFFHTVMKQHQLPVEIELTHEHTEQSDKLANLSEKMNAILATQTLEERGTLALAFYRELNQFIADYLIHLEKEESTMPLLNEVCSEEELKTALFGLLGGLTEVQILESVAYMLPALNAQEGSALMKGLGISSPDLKDLMWETARFMLNEREWIKLKKYSMS